MELVQKKAVYCLIVDDEPDIRNILKTFLTDVHKEIQVIEASNGMEGLNKMSLQKFHLLITDLKMPKLSGNQMLLAIKELPTDFIPKHTLIVTGHQENMETLNQLGFKYSVIDKPIDPSKLTKYFEKIFGFDNEKYFMINVDIVSKYQEKFPFDLFLKLSNEKMVQISHKNENRTETVNKYISKGVKEFYVIKEEYTSFLKNLKKNMTEKFSNPEKVRPTKDLVEILNSGHHMLKDSFIRMDIGPESIELAREIAESSLKIIQNTPNIFKFFLEFKENCSSEFLINIFVVYTVNCMMETFDWQSESLKTKCALAAFLCDVTLTKEDFKLLSANVNDITKLTPKVKNHPFEIADMLGLQIENMSFDILNIIRQHHELPNGKGFPRGVDYTKITLLSAIHIVARFFVEAIVANKFNFSSIPNVITESSNRFHQGVFKEAIGALKKIMNPNDS